MNKISKNLFVGATALTLSIGAIAGVVPAFAVDVPDGDAADLNTSTGAVASPELVQITAASVLSISTGNPGLVTSITSDGTPTPLIGLYTQSPGTITGVIPGTQVDGYSSQIIKSNDPDGYFMSIMMCNDTASTNYPTVVAGCKGSNVLDDATLGGVVIEPTASGATLGGTIGANTGGFWGYRSNSVVSGAAAITAPAGNWNPVPSFSDATPYGTKLVDTTTVGAAAVNVNFGVITNSALPAGTYSNYVIFTAVQN